ncbi:hypothetical protein B0H13DRAFT_1932188 [Mycena leptocephala]|nr:hypothetical protein B0H13DRAFT_1932188 [Mycena leptocephala]
MYSLQPSRRRGFIRYFRHVGASLFAQDTSVTNWGVNRRIEIHTIDVPRARANNGTVRLVGNPHRRIVEVELIRVCLANPDDGEKADGGSRDVEGELERQVACANRTDPARHDGGSLEAVDRAGLDLLEVDRGARGVIREPDFERTDEVSPALGIGWGGSGGGRRCWCEVAVYALDRDVGAPADVALHPWALRLLLLLLLGVGLPLRAVASSRYFCWASGIVFPSIPPPELVQYGQISLEWAAKATLPGCCVSASVSRQRFVRRVPGQDGGSKSGPSVRCQGAVRDVRPLRDSQDVAQERQDALLNSFQARWCAGYIWKDGYSLGSSGFKSRKRARQASSPADFPPWKRRSSWRGGRPAAPDPSMRRTRTQTSGPPSGDAAGPSGAVVGTEGGGRRPGGHTARSRPEGTAGGWSTGGERVVSRVVRAGRARRWRRQGRDALSYESIAALLGGGCWRELVEGIELYIESSVRRDYGGNHSGAPGEEVKKRETARVVYNKVAFRD